jgi:Leucine Rich repeat
MWVISRSMRMSHFLVNPEHFSRSPDIARIVLSTLGQECGQLLSIDFSGCMSITDIGVSALVHGCGQLRSINLEGCGSIADIGVSAIGHGCGQLRSIDLNDCCRITDIRISALARGCGQLQFISLSCFSSRITDIGISARSATVDRSQILWWHHRHKSFSTSAWMWSAAVD